jgi:IclR family transcriptional regulator, acetate operon repressor
MLMLARQTAPGVGLREAALPHMAALGERTGETIHLSVPDRLDRVVLIERVDSVHPVRTFHEIGVSSPFHATASGKAIMAMLPDDDVQEILSRPLDKVMDNTSTDPRHLRHQILEARDRGYAVNISENRPNVCAVAAAITDPTGRPLGAVTISMPDIRFVPERVPEWGKSVAATVRAINEVLAGAGSAGPSAG